MSNLKSDRICLVDQYWVVLLWTLPHAKLQCLGDIISSVLQFHDWIPASNKIIMQKSSIMLRKTSLGLNIASQEICRCSVSEHRTWSTSWSWFSLVSLRSISRFRSIILIAYNLLSSVLRHSFTCTLRTYRGQTIWFFRCSRIAFFMMCQRHQEEVVQFQRNYLPNIHRPNIFNFSTRHHHSFSCVSVFLLLRTQGWPYHSCHSQVIWWQCIGSRICTHSFQNTQSRHFRLPQIPRLNI